MRIIRFLDSKNCIRFGKKDPDGGITVLEGDIFSDKTETREPAEVKKILAPVAPAAILAIGLNYRKHAEETGLKIPQYPVLFMKTVR